jgi:hypothetical protein
LPAVTSCNAPLTPGIELINSLRDPTSGLWDWVASIAVFGVAYLLGALSLLGALERSIMEGWLGRFCAIAQCLILSSVALVTIGACAHYYVGRWTLPRILDDLLVLGAAIGVLTHCSSALHARLTLPLTMRWLTGVVCIIWFVFHLKDALFGLYVSLLGALCLTCGTTQEARLRSTRSLGGAFWTLLTCRYALADLNGACCAACGYSLHGLPQPRCPECGTPFDPNRLGNAETEVMPAAPRA